MSNHGRATTDSTRVPATGAEVRSILGDIDDADVLEILNLAPTVVELEEAAIWSIGDGDVLAKQGRPLSGAAADVYEILSRPDQDVDDS